MASHPGGGRLKIGKRGEGTKLALKKIKKPQYEATCRVSKRARNTDEPEKSLQFSVNRVSTCRAMVSFIGLAPSFFLNSCAWVRDEESLRKMRAMHAS